MRLVGDVSEEWSCRSEGERVSKTKVKERAKCLSKLRETEAQVEAVDPDNLDDLGKGCLISKVKQKPSYHGLRNPGRQRREKTSLLFQED